MGYSISVYDVKGKLTEEKKLDDNIFNDDNINESLLHEFVVMQLSNSRINIAHTKTRWDITASNRKLYRQKWTGKARVGDAASPIRRKGWVAFGPRNERNFTKAMPKKQRRKALFAALTKKVKAGGVLWLNNYSFKEIRTKDAVSVLDKLSISEKKTLVVISERNDLVYKSFSNVPLAKTILVNYLNPKDLLTYSNVLFIGDSLEKVSEIFLSK